MAKKDSRESRLLGISIGFLLPPIPAFAGAATLRAGAEPASAPKHTRESRLLHFSIGFLLLLIAAFAVSATLRVGPKPASTPKHPIRIELLNGSGRPGLAGELA